MVGTLVEIGLGKRCADVQGIITHATGLPQGKLLPQRGSPWSVSNGMARGGWGARGLGFFFGPFTHVGQVSHTSESVIFTGVGLGVVNIECRLGRRRIFRGEARAFVALHDGHSRIRRRIFHWLSAAVGADRLGLEIVELHRTRSR